MAADAPAGDREAELAAVRPVAAGGVELEPGGAEPAGGEVLEQVAGGEDAQRLAVEVGAVVLGRWAYSYWSARSHGTPRREPPR